MAIASSDDQVQWAEETYTISQVVEKGLPQIVRVSDGYWDNEDESFSSGDILNLDSVKTIHKVVAKCVDQSNEDVVGNKSAYSTLKDDILIPVGYTGKLKVVRPMQRNHLYRNVDDLIKYFPKRIKAEKSIIVNASDHSFELPIGAQLELVMVLPEQGLVCKYNDKDILLHPGDSVEFSSIREDKDYTLKEVTEMFRLPQIVEFIEPEFRETLFKDLEEAIANSKDFTGRLKLDRIIEQSVIVGHLKPSSVRNDPKETFSKRYVALLPLDSAIVQEIEVQLPIFANQKIYETLGIKRFNDRNMKTVEEGLYIEFKNLSKPHMLKEEDGPNDSPPPIPPRALSLHNQYPVKPKESQNQVHTDVRRHLPLPPDEAIEGSRDCPQATPPPMLIGDIDFKHTSKSRSLSRAVSNKFLKMFKMSPAKSYETTNIRPEDDGYEELRTVTSPGKDTAKSRFNLVDPVKSFFKRSLSLGDYATGIGIQNDHYDVISSDTSTISSDSSGKKQPWNKKASPIIRSSSNVSEVTNTKTTDDVYTIIDSSAVASSRIVSGKQLTGIVSPRSREKPSVQGSFETLDSNEIGQLLKECGLEKFAFYCKQNRLVGHFISQLSEKTLGDFPFCLSREEIDKLQSIKKGWRP